MSFCVYRYVDKKDGIVKYIGETYGRNSDPLARHIEHMQRDWWAKISNYRVEFIECANRAETEAREADLIRKYRTDKWYNRAKRDWGEISCLPEISEEDWQDISVLADRKEQHRMLMEASDRRPGRQKSTESIVYAARLAREDKDLLEGIRKNPT